jgi:hypothetical protein
MAKEKLACFVEQTERFASAVDQLIGCISAVTVIARAAKKHQWAEPPKDFLRNVSVIQAGVALLTPIFEQTERAYNLVSDGHVCVEGFAGRGVTGIDARDVLPGIGAFEGPNAHLTAVRFARVFQLCLANAIDPKLFRALAKRKDAGFDVVAVGRHWEGVVEAVLGFPLWNASKLRTQVKHERDRLIAKIISGDLAGIGLSGKAAERAIGALKAHGHLSGPSGIHDSNSSQIAAENRTKPMSYRKAAKYMGKGDSQDAAEWLSKCVGDGTIKCEHASRQTHVFCRNNFPKSAWPQIMPATQPKSLKTQPKSRD